jgi:hypothetical protein
MWNVGWIEERNITLIFILITNYELRITNYELFNKWFLVLVQS